MGERKRYSKEFKQEAVRLAKEPDRSVLQVAQGLGISDSALHRWVREFAGQGGAAFPGHGKQVLSVGDNFTFSRSWRAKSLD